MEISVAPMFILQTFQRRSCPSSRLYCWTGSELFSKKFCSVQWVENVDVSQTALAAFANVEKYISFAKKLPATFVVKTVRFALMS